MTNHPRSILVLLAVLGTTSAALANGADPLRCEARKLRCDSEYFQCVSRCDRRAARVAARPAGARPAATDTTCEEKCVVRHERTMLRIATTSPCAETDTPDPATCEARLLRLAANDRLCEARCGRRERRTGEATECLARCQARCDGALDDVLAQIVCAEGRMSGEEVCGE